MTTIGDVILVMDDLYTDKLALIEETLAYKLFDPTFRIQRNDLGSLQASLGKKPLVEDLKDSDTLFDSCGRATYYISLGLSQLVILPRELRDLVAEIKESFVPSLSVLQKSYQDQAADAKRNLDELEARQTELKAFPVAPEISFYTLIKTQLDAGLQIDQLLSKRAATITDEQSKQIKEVTTLRARVIGTLNKFRETLRQEIVVNPDLPRDLDAQVFSYYDQIVASREARKSKPQSETESATE